MRRESSISDLVFIQSFFLSSLSLFVYLGVFHRITTDSQTSFIYLNLKQALIKRCLHGPPFLSKRTCYMFLSIALNMIWKNFIYSGMPKTERPKTEQRRNPNEMISHFSSVRISDIQSVRTTVHVRILDVTLSQTIFAVNFLCPKTELSN